MNIERMQDYIAGARSLVDASGKQANSIYKALSPEARRGLAVLATGGLIFLFFAMVLFLWGNSMQEEVQRLRAERDMVAARAAKSSGKSATRLGTSDDVEGMFLQGETPGLALAAFQSVVSEAASASGLSVKRMQPLDSGDAEAGAPYRLGVDADGSLEQLRIFLAKIESMLPVMFVTGLEIRPSSSEGTQDPFPSEALKISVRIDAYGWRSPQ
ncbi:type II secretion system protein GspM [Aestuariivirga sp.]|uniref:type II secretion system protein GspM n=1 Tax=Aestuariivirga sp. TaxID=2650926 RepID=UPI003BAC11B6